MGQTLLELSKRKISKQSVFNSRFVVEICENVHTHYRNLRFINSMYDWLQVADGFVSSLERWKKRGKPAPESGKHIELCRKNIQNEDFSDEIRINLNKNLYEANKDKIYSEGAGLTDPTYIHVKIRDIRLEMTREEFKELADAVKEAQERLEDSDISSVLQTT